MPQPLGELPAPPLICSASPGGAGHIEGDLFALIISPDHGLIANGKVGGFNEGPAQILVPVLRVAGPFAYAVAHMRTADTAAIAPCDWFEGRGPRCVLMAYIDDASSRVFARFDEYEGTIPAMDSFQRYIRQHGIPLAVYADKHTTYRSPAEPTIEEQLAGAAPQSQFGRALAELGVELIAAHSPQAKGRVERLFKTFQDRVIKELRLAKVSTLDAAHAFLTSYLPIYNRRFAVLPAQTADLHRPRLARGELDRILCIKTKRVLRRDWTMARNGHLYQVQTNVRATQVVMEERVDGTLRMTHQGHVLAYARIADRPGRSAALQTVSCRHRPVTQAQTHPWRKRALPPRELLAAEPIT